jgi:hypothetical protein
LACPQKRGARSAILVCVFGVDFEHAFGPCFWRRFEHAFSVPEKFQKHVDPNRPIRAPTFTDLAGKLSDQAAIKRHAPALSRLLQTGAEPAGFRRNGGLLCERLSNTPNRALATRSAAVHARVGLNARNAASGRLGGSMTIAKMANPQQGVCKARHAAICQSGYLCITHLPIAPWR